MFKETLAGGIKFFALGGDKYQRSRGGEQLRTWKFPLDKSVEQGPSEKQRRCGVGQGERKGGSGLTLRQSTVVCSGVTVEVGNTVVQEARVRAPGQ